MGTKINKDEIARHAACYKDEKFIQNFNPKSEGTKSLERPKFVGLRIKLKSIPKKWASRL
jgi:hypothetical protein